MPSKSVILIPAIAIGLLLMALMLIHFDTFGQSRGILLGGGVIGAALGTVMLTSYVHLPFSPNESTLRRGVVWGAGVVLCGGLTMLAAAARIGWLIVLFALSTAVCATMSLYFKWIQLWLERGPRAGELDDHRPNKS